MKLKKIALTLMVATVADSVSAACNSRDLRGTWDYYQGVSYAANKSNISKCEAAFSPSGNGSGTFAGWCYISPGKGPRTVTMQGNFTVTNAQTCAVEVKMDMGAMGISTFVFNLNSPKSNWTGMWKNVAGDYGVTNGVKVSKSTSTPVTPTNNPYF